MNNNDKLKNRILKEMVIDHSTSLEKHFSIVKNFLRITKTGKVDIINKEKFSGKEQIIIYLIGKIYAFEAGLTKSKTVSNKEFKEELMVPGGSLRPWLKDLREQQIIAQTKKDKVVYHSFLINRIEKTIINLQKKIDGD